VLTVSYQLIDQSTGDACTVQHAACTSLALLLLLLQLLVVLKSIITRRRAAVTLQAALSRVRRAALGTHSVCVESIDNSREAT